MEDLAKNKEWWEWTKALLIAVGIAAIIRYFLFAPIVVDGLSMMPTLHNGDRMIVSKLHNEPKRFDIVVFHAPENKDYIKRVIGLPGDKVEYINDTLFINGKAYDEPYLEDYKVQMGDTLLTDNFVVEEIPEGHIFVMGDNRQYSRDSRHIGTVDLDKIVGKTNVIYWPIEDITLIK